MRSLSLPHALPIFGPRTYFQALIDHRGNPPLEVLVKNLDFAGSSHCSFKSVGAGLAGCRYAVCLSCQLIERIQLRHIAGVYSSP